MITTATVDDDNKKRQFIHAFKLYDKLCNVRYTQETKKIFFSVLESNYQTFLRQERTITPLIKGEKEEKCDYYSYLRSFYECMIGECYYFGFGTEVDIQTGLELIRFGAKGGCFVGKYRLMMELEEQRLIKDEKSCAFLSQLREWMPYLSVLQHFSGKYSTAYADGNLYAYSHYAEALFYNDNSLGDKAILICNEALSHGIITALYTKSRIIPLKDRPFTLKHDLVYCANVGYPKAICLFVQYYENNTLMGRNMLNIAAKLACWDAFLSLGDLYTHGMVLDRSDGNGYYFRYSAANKSLINRKMGIKIYEEGYRLGCRYCAMECVIFYCSKEGREYSLTHVDKNNKPSFIYERALKAVSRCKEYCRKDFFYSRAFLKLIKNGRLWTEDPFHVLKLVVKLVCDTRPAQKDVQVFVGGWSTITLGEFLPQAYWYRLLYILSYTGVKHAYQTLLKLYPEKKTPQWSMQNTGLFSKKERLSIFGLLLVEKRLLFATKQLVKSVCKQWRLPRKNSLGEECL